jgi:hypothetical protein
MNKKNKKQSHQIQGRTKSVMNPTTPGRNGRTKGTLLLVVLLVAAGLLAHALNALERTKGSGAVAGSNPLLLTATAAQPPLVPAVASTASTNTVGSRIQFATPVHDFGKIKGGEVVKYTYVFTNIGDRLLEVTSVRPSCGCTTAGEWSRQVEPGKTGGIPIQYNSGNFRGQVAKSITVTCNDANQPRVVLHLKATIWKPIDVTPQLAALNVTSESPSNATTVRIVSNEEAPLTLSTPESSNPAFAAELRTNQPGKEFLLIVKTVPPLLARKVQGQITLKTSSTNMPVINVTALANVQQTMMVMPSQISLPTAPLANARPYTISIRYSGMIALTLTEPAVNAKGVDVQLKELYPGRYFTLTVSFPAGFEIAQGEKVELSVKSNHPQFPVIKVPVLQPPRPAPTAKPAPGRVGSPTPPQAAAQEK